VSFWVVVYMAGSVAVWGGPYATVQRCEAAEVTYNLMLGEGTDMTCERRASEPRPFEPEPGRL
jgi:hypothetical protein